MPLVEKLNKAHILKNGGPSLKGISWQSGKTHPGAPKYILYKDNSYIKTKQFLCYCFKTTDTKYMLKIHWWTMDENNNDYKRFEQEAHGLPKGNYGQPLVELIR